MPAKPLDKKLPTRLYRTGAQLATLAVEADNAKKYPEALSLYQKSAEYLVTGLRADQYFHKREAARRDRPVRRGYFRVIDRRGRRIGLVSSKLSSFLDRAEAIKAYLDELQRAPQQSKKLVPVNAKSVDEIFKGVIGAEGAKQALLEAVYLPQKFPSVFAGGRAPWSGVLLFGPPGTGKTELASAVANHNNCHFVAVSAADLVSKFQGESARNVRKLFEDARKQEGPTVIFLDEIDALGASRNAEESSDIRQVKNELLRQLDGFQSKKDSARSAANSVTFLCATNHPWELDSALLRRLQQRIHVPLPTSKDRAALLAHFLRDEVHSISKQDLARLASRCAGYSGSDLAVLVREALMHPIREALRSKHFRNVSNRRDRDGSRSAFEHLCSNYVFVIPFFLSCAGGYSGDAKIHAVFIAFARRTPSQNAGPSGTSSDTTPCCRPQRFLRSCVGALCFQADSVVLPPVTVKHLEHALASTRCVIACYCVAVRTNACHRPPSAGYIKSHPAFESSCVHCRSCRPSVSPAEAARHNEYAKKFGTNTQATTKSSNTTQSVSQQRNMWARPAPRNPTAANRNRGGNIFGAILNMFAPRRPQPATTSRANPQSQAQARAQARPRVKAKRVLVPS